MTRHDGFKGSKTSIILKQLVYLFMYMYQIRQFRSSQGLPVYILFSLHILQITDYKYNVYVFLYTAVLVSVTVDFQDIYIKVQVTSSTVHFMCSITLYLSSPGYCRLSKALHDTLLVSAVVHCFSFTIS